MQHVKGQVGFVHKTVRLKRQQLFLKYTGQNYTGEHVFFLTFSRHISSMIFDDIYILDSIYVSPQPSRTRIRNCMCWVVPVKHILTSYGHERSTEYSHIQLNQMIEAFVTTLSPFVTSENIAAFFSFVCVVLFTTTLP